MNERTRELIRLADVHILPDDSEYGHCIIGLERFAELIVAECVSAIESRAVEGAMSEYYIKQIEKHFGVES